MSKGYFQQKNFSENGKGMIFNEQNRKFPRVHSHCELNSVSLSTDSTNI